MSINSFPHPRAMLSHLVAHAGYFSGLPEPHWSLPSKNFPPLFPTEPPHPSEVGTQQGLLWHKVLANCLPDPSDWAGYDFGKSGKDYVLPKRDMKSDLPEACYRNRLFCKALLHEKLLSPSYRGRPAIHEGRQMRSQNTPAPH